MVEISGKCHFDGSRVDDVLWLQIWQLDPLAHRATSYPVNIFVDSSTSWLFKSFLRGVSLSYSQASLSNVVVFLAASDLAPESHLSGSTSSDVLLKAFLQVVDFELVETDTGPFVDFGVSSQVWQVTDWSRHHSLTGSSLGVWISLLDEGEVLTSLSDLLLCSFFPRLVSRLGIVPRLTSSKKLFSLLRMLH